MVVFFRKIKVFALLCVSLCVLSGCNLKVNTDTYENVDMTPRLISMGNNASVVEIVENVKSAVVGIQANLNNGYAIGSGVAIKEGGYILTNQHVVNGAKSLIVYLADKSSTGASIIWQDASLDMAVIRCNINLPYLKASEDNILVGEDVIAIGTPLSLDFKHTVTKGIVSALNRTLQVENSNGTISYMQNLIQHDASINPGNSGGPLINSKGEVVGINTLKASDAEGIGFAIPISVGKSAVEKLSANENWNPSYLGIFGVDSEIAMFQGEKVGVNYGVYVAEIDDKTINKDCFKKGDIIIEINGKTIKNVLDLRLAIYNLSSGDNAYIKILRDGEIVEINCKIGSK